ncbi:MAG: N-carbamoylputrescine amidase, partial [Pirellulaceae bacterium]
MTPKVALIQMTCSTSKQENVEKSIRRIEEAAASGANVIGLQELFHGQYPCQSEDHRKFQEAETIPGPITQTLSTVAARLGVVIVASLFEQRAA